MNGSLPLFYICEAAGVLMILGGIWLIYKQKIFLDPQTKQVLQVQVPLFGTLKTNVPALGLFVIGFIPLIYPIAKLTTRYLQVEQDIKSDDHPVAVYVAVQGKILHENGKMVVSVPILDNADYTPELIYLAGPITDQTEIELTKQKHGILLLDPKHIEDKRHLALTNIPAEITPPPGEYR